MWILILGLIALTVSGIAYEDAHFSVSSLEEGNRLNLEAENQAHLFELYREAVNAYAAGNPEFSGTVPEGELALPAGMIVPPGFSNSVSGGVAYAWISPGKGVSPDGILGALSGISDGSVLVGMKQGGRPGLPDSGEHRDFPSFGNSRRIRRVHGRNHGTRPDVWRNTHLAPASVLVFQYQRLRRDDPECVSGV